MGFDEIEWLLESGLPPSARVNRGFWSNRGRGGYQASAWMEAGYHVDSVDLEAERVVFRRPVLRYQVEREGQAVRWNAEMVRALREYLDLNQEELAELLGVRQQTVSEWETEEYQPTRSRSKHLTIVAERAGFPLQDDAEEDLDKGHGTV